MEEIKEEALQAEQAANEKTASPTDGGKNWVTKRQIRRGSHPDLWDRLHRKTTAVRVAIVSIALFLLSSALSTFLFVEYISLERKYKDEKTQADQAQLALQEEKNNAASQLADLKAEREVLANRLKNAQEELEAWQNQSDPELRNEIEELKALIEQKDSEIEMLQTMLNPGEEVDLLTIAEKIESVKTLLENGAPKKKVSVKKTDESGMIYYEDEWVYPNISLYVTDLSRGYSYIHGAGNTYDIGNLRYLLLALSVFDCAEKEAQSMEDGTLVGESKYDLLLSYVLTAQDVAPGQGVLSGKTVGTQMTYLSLLETMLMYSDAGAYRILSAQYPEAVGAFLQTSDGLKGLSVDSAMSARNMMALVDKANEMICGDGRYIENLKNAMTGAVSTCFAQAVSGTVAQQCSLTTAGYHEIALQLTGDTQMLVVLMSDMTEKTSDVEAYFLSLYTAIDDLMQSMA